MVPRYLMLSAFLAPGISIFAADWPHFHGPGGAWTQPSAKHPGRWSDTENIVWKTPLEGMGITDLLVVEASP